MDKSLLLVFIIGGIIAAGLKGSYLIQTHKFKVITWLQVSFLGLMIGMVFAYLLHVSFALFFVLLALCSAVIVNSANLARNDEKIEFMVLSISGGTFMGLITMVGCCVLCT